MSQQSKTTLQSAINTQLADNTSGDISAADVRDNLINMTDSLLFNNETTQTLTGALTVTAGITGSLEGTSTTASYVENAVSASYATQALSASWAPNPGGSSFPYTGSALITGSLGITGSLTQHAGNIAMGVADTFGNRNINLSFNGSNEYVTLGAGDNSSKPNRLQLYSSTGVSQLIAANEILLFAPTIVLSGSVLFEKAITSSLQGTASYATTSATASYVEGSNVNGYVDLANNTDQIYINSTFNISEDFPIVFSSISVNSYGAIQNDIQNFNYNPVTNRLTLSGSQVITGSLNVTGGITGSVYVPYKEYTVLLTYAPVGGVFTVNSLTNTLGTITWNDPTPGVFTATKANAFPNESKVYISPTFVGSGADIYALTGIVSNTNVIEFTITKLSDSTSNSSPFLLLIPITIKVYD